MDLKPKKQVISWLLSNMFLMANLMDVMQPVIQLVILKEVIMLLKAGTGKNIKNFIYGANVKVLFSHLETYNSLALATDLSAGFHNEKNN